MADIKVILFDFDGTLVDSMHEYALSAARIISTASTWITHRQAYHQYIASSGLSFPEQLNLIVPELVSSHTDLNQAFCKIKLQILNRLTFEKSTVRMLETLKKRGYKLGISTNNEIEIVRQFLDRQSCAHHFDSVLGLTDGIGKGPAHFYHIKSKFNVTNDQILFVGDSLNDSQKAADSFVSFVGVTGTFSRADFQSKFSNCTVIDTLVDLLSSPTLLGVGENSCSQSY